MSTANELLKITKKELVGLQSEEMFKNVIHLRGAIGTLYLAVIDYCMVPCFLVGA